MAFPNHFPFGQLSPGSNQRGPEFVVRTDKGFGFVRGEVTSSELPGGEAEISTAIDVRLVLNEAGKSDRLIEDDFTGLTSRPTLNQPGSTCAMAVPVQFDCYVMTALLAVAVLDVVFDSTRTS